MKDQTPFNVIIDVRGWEGLFTHTIILVRGTS